MTTLKALDDLGNVRDRIFPNAVVAQPSADDRSLTDGNTWWEMVTPERASKLLKSNSRNRKMNERVVRKYTGEMKAGRWRKIGAPIQLTTEGTILDGQHRLMAILQSRCQQNLLFVVLEDADAMDAIDTGKKRSFNDYLTIKGVHHASTVASAVRSYVNLRRYEHDEGSPNELPIPVLWDEFSRVEWQIWEAAAKVAGLGEVKRLGMSVSLSACYVAFCVNGNQAEAAEFVEKVKTGSELREGDPIHTLRKTMSIVVADKVRSASIRGKLMMVVKAWNYWVRGNDLWTIKVQGQSFPKIALVPSVR